MRHQLNPYLQSFELLGDWALSNDALTDHQMVIHSNRLPTNEHVRRCDRPQNSEVAAIVLEAEDGIISTQDNVLQKRGNFNAYGNEFCDTISVTHQCISPMIL